MSYWRFIPNLITLLRFATVPLLVWWLLDKQFQNALLLCLLMGASDALDGFLARAFDWKTTLGSYLDPAADKVMLISAYVALGILDLLPHWLVFIVIIRDVALLAGAVSYVSSTRRFDIKPSLISKFNTFIQILLVLAVIFGQVNDFPTVIIQIFIGLTLCTTIASGYDYFIAERSRRASNQSSKRA
jgi:cardiolipin synthase